MRRDHTEAARAWAGVGVVPGASSMPLATSKNRSGMASESENNEHADPRMLTVVVDETLQQGGSVKGVIHNYT